MPPETPFSNSVFLIEVNKINPNPFQPRKEFDEAALQSLAESIKQYGVLQPIVVTRQEVEREDGGLSVEYELVAGERRLRASKLAGLATIPAVIRTGDQTDKMKLEVAIIENLQREDLNPVDRAEAFKRLLEEFGYKHTEVAKKIGKSREYVSNTVRILMLPGEIINSLRQGEITEGHTRPLLMLIDRPEEQATLHKDIMLRRLTVRESERLARRIAIERVRKFQTMPSPEIMEAEEKLSEQLGARVSIEDLGVAGGKIVINYYSNDELPAILERMSVAHISGPEVPNGSAPIDDSTPADLSDDSDLYSVTNFTL